MENKFIGEPIKKHISYYTRRNVDNTIELHEIFDIYYMHPDSDSDNSTHVNRIEDHRIEDHRIEDHKIISYKMPNRKASPLLLMEYAQNNIEIMIGEINNGK